MPFSASPDLSVRTRALSPMPGTSPRPARRGTWRRILGGSPWASSSHSAGTAISSPSASRSVISVSTTSGNAPARCSFLRRFSIAPSPARSRSICLRAARSAFLRPKARAISRVPTLPASLPMKASTSSLEGSGVCLRDWGFKYTSRNDVRRVARMERSEIREWPIPDYASLHPGYEPLDNRAATELPVASLGALSALRRSLGCRRFLGGVFRRLFGHRACPIGWRPYRSWGFLSAWLGGLYRRGLCRLFLRRLVRRRRLGGGFRRFTPRGRTAPAAIGDLLGTRRQQRERFFKRHGLRRLVLGQGRVDAVGAHIGAIAAGLHHHRPAPVRVIAERAAGIAAEPPAARSLG